MTKSNDDDPVPLGVKSGRPHTFGYLRRPTFDTRKGECWESPDGELILLLPGHKMIYKAITPRVTHTNKKEKK